MLFSPPLTPTKTRSPGRVAASGGCYSLTECSLTRSTFIFAQRGSHLVLDPQDQTGPAVGIFSPENYSTVLGLTFLTADSILQAEPGHQLWLQDGLSDAAHHGLGL